LFCVLLDAFSQDMTKKRYAGFDEVPEYCRRSANPFCGLFRYLYAAVTRARIGKQADFRERLRLWQRQSIGDFVRGVTVAAVLEGDGAQSAASAALRSA
jgi:hypothetical protein